MKHLRQISLLTLCLAGCDQAFVTPRDSGPVGLGLKASFGVATEECDQGLFMDERCYDNDHELRSGRATNDNTSYVGIQGTSALFRAEGVGVATGEIETTGGETYDFEFDVVEIDDQRLELIGAYQDIYPVEHPALLTRATIDFNHITKAYGFAGYLQDVRGSADVDIETATQARIGATHILIELVTGAVPGEVTLHTSSGLSYDAEIVGPPQIAGLDIYDDKRRTTTALVLGSVVQRIQLVPLLADHRPIAGCGADQPRVTVSSLAVRATLVNAGAYCAINVLREDPGDATLTIEWGGATVTLPVDDPAMP